MSTTLLTAAIALPVALTRRAPHDDEGFYLYSLRLFAHHGGVFNHVLTAYGAAYHELMAAPLTLLGLSIDHNSGRVMTAVMAALITAAAALVCLRITGRLSAAVLGQVAAFIAVLPVTGEPMEPSLLVLLFLALIVLAVSGPRAGPVRRGVLVGACVAVLALTKINIGALAGVAALVALVGVSARPRSPLWAAGLALGLAPPVILLVGGRDEPSVVGFALLVMLLVVGLQVARSPRRWPLHRVEPIAMVVAGGCCAVLIGAVAVAWGESAQAMIRGTFFAGLTRASTVAFQFTWLPLVIATTALALPALMAARAPRARLWLRLVGVTIAIVVALLLLQPASFPANGLELLGLLLGPILLLPGTGEPTEASLRGRRLLATLTVLEALQVYPISGDQVSFALFPALLAGVVIASDMAPDLNAALRARLGQVITAAAVLLLIGPISLGIASWQAWSQAPSLTLSGASLIHRPTADNDVTEQVVAAADRSGCRSLVTYPGMLSFYLWSSLPPPAGVQLADGTWWTLDPYLEPTERALSQLHDVCLIRNPSDEIFWSELGLTPPDSRFTSFLANNFHELAAYGGYQLWLRS
ncbi:MAG TPA: hypothetical protein VEY89_07620 [Candidatus Dormibacteraeota bacterium]|nr:hypothetical protein [Candidatus Dormibacteraeota bacterium]